MTAISFNSNDLQTASIITSEINHHDLPDRSVAMYSVAHRNRSRIANPPEYPSRKITVSGTLVADNIADLDALIDTFKAYFRGYDKPLDIEYAGGTRRYIATVAPNGIRIPRPGGLAWTTFTIQFVCSIPFGMDIASTSLLSVVGNTATPNTDAVTIGGSADFQYPIIELTLNSGTQLSAGTMSFANNQTGQQLDITRDWMAADSVLIDPYNDVVTVNSVEVDFGGALPIFVPGAASFTYSDTFLTRNVDYELSQYRYWL